MAFTYFHTYLIKSLICSTQFVERTADEFKIEPFWWVTSIRYEFNEIKISLNIVSYDWYSKLGLIIIWKLTLFSLIRLHVESPILFVGFLESSQFTRICDAASDSEQPLPLSSSWLFTCVRKRKPQTWTQLTRAKAGLVPLLRITYTHR